MILDATVLSNFASTDAIEVLVELLESPAVVPAVIEEIDEGRDFGYEYLTVAIETFGEGIQILDAEPADGTPKIRDRLDAGEAESLLAAIEHRGTLGLTTSPPVRSPTNGIGQSSVLSVCSSWP